MPPDYKSKNNKKNNPEDVESSRLESLEEKLYENKFSQARQKTYFSDYKPTPVRNEWAESNLPKERIAEPVSTRNTFAFLKQILIGSVILFIVSVSIAAYVFIGGRNIVSTKNILININTPVSIAGGEKLPVEITIANQNNVPLVSADVVVEYSDGGRQPNDLNQELKRYRETVDSLDVGEILNKKYEVVFFGEEGESKDIKVTLEYRVKGSNAIFSKTETRSVAISSAPVSVSVLSPSEASAGEAVEFSVAVSANSSDVVGHLMLSFDYPFGFQFNSSDPKPIYGNNVWDLGDLKPGSTRTIKVRGQFSGSEGEEKVVRFSVGTADIKDSRKIGVVFLSKTQTISIAKPPIALNLALGGSSDSEYVTDAGRSIRADILLKNNLDTKITNVSVEAKLTGSILNRESVSAQSGFYRSIDNTVVWDQTTEKSLDVLAPGDGESLSFSFNTLQAASTLKSSSMNIVVTVRASSLSADSKVEQVQISTSKVVKIASQLGVSAKAFYSSGPFQNSGPIPPKVEQETTYTIGLSITNSSNDLSDVTVKTSLPIYVKWLDKVSPESEDLKYNPIGGEIVWNVGDLKAGEGPRDVYFQVSFLPGLNQVRNYPVLVNSVSASGYDRFSSINLTASQPNFIDISLPSDPTYKGSGGPVTQ